MAVDGSRQERVNSSVHHQVCNITDFDFIFSALAQIGAISDPSDQGALHRSSNITELDMDVLDMTHFACSRNMGVSVVLVSGRCQWMSILTLNSMGRALKHLEREVRQIKKYITVQEMLDLSEQAHSSHYGQSKCDDIVGSVILLMWIIAHFVQATLEGFYSNRF